MERLLGPRPGPGLELPSLPFSARGCPVRHLEAQALWLEGVGSEPRKRLSSSTPLFAYGYKEVDSRLLQS